MNLAFAFDECKSYFCLLILEPDKTKNGKNFRIAEEWRTSVEFMSPE